MDIYVFDMARVARFGSNILCFGHDEIYCKFCIFRISDKVKNNNFVVNILKNIDDSLIPKYCCMCYLWLAQFGVKIGDTQVVSQSISILRCAFSPALSGNLFLGRGWASHKWATEGQRLRCRLFISTLRAKIPPPKYTPGGSHTSKWCLEKYCFISLFFKRFSRHKYQDCRYVCLLRCGYWLRIILSGMH